MGWRSLEWKLKKVGFSSWPESVILTSQPALLAVASLPKATALHPGKKPSPTLLSISLSPPLPDLPVMESQFEKVRSNRACFQSLECVWNSGFVGGIGESVPSLTPKGSSGHPCLSLKASFLDVCAVAWRFR